MIFELILRSLWQFLSVEIILSSNSRTFSLPFSPFLKNHYTSEHFQVFLVKKTNTNLVINVKKEEVSPGIFT